MAEEVDYTQYDEATLIEMRDNATDYETRSKIRAAIRDLKKKSGLLTGRRPTGSSQYRRPGFQAPRTVTIPNSVTGNVYPMVVKEGVVTKGVDSTTPTIGYLNAQTVKTRKGSKEHSSPSHVTVGSQIPKGSSEESSWWRKSHSSSQSTSPGVTPEPKDRRPSANDTLAEDTFESRQKSPTPEPPKELSPSPEPPKEPIPSPEPPKEPTPSPEPPKEPTPSPEPPKEPTPSPEPPKEPTPSPEPPKEPTPSPEPPKEPTPSPEPPKEPTPSPEPPKEPSPSPEPPKEHTPSPDYERREEEEEEEEYYEDEEDEELRQLEEKYPESSSPRKHTTEPIPDVFTIVEPGMEEEKDFRKKLRRTEDSKIDTKAAFPSTKKGAEQVDFRNLLKKSDGPGKKDIKSGSKAQVDFRTSLRPNDTSSPVVPPNIINTINQEEKQQSTTTTTNDDNKDKSESPVPVPVEEQQTKPPPEEDSYEARREARRREREAMRQQEKEKKTESSEKDSTTKTSGSSTGTGGDEEDSYEARREARRKAREERLKMEAETSDSSPKLTYRERKQKEEAKMRADMKANKQKWSEMDQSNGGGNTDRSYTRQKSTNSGAQQLMAWCQHKTRYYENVEIKDFSNSWRDGLALCAILHNFVPDAIPFDDLTPDNPRKNYTVALKAADDAGLDSFFDVEDIIAAGSPDPKSMMTFLATIYTHFK